MRLARHYLVSGRVQGVGFRYFASDVASRENLDGWVRNLPDGRVEIEAEGDAEALTRFEHRLRQGPRSAEVERLDVEERQPGGRAHGFFIR